MTASQTVTICNPPALRVERIPKPGVREKILRANWQVVHLPTDLVCGEFRLRKTATQAVAWFKANVPSELLAGADVAAIDHRVEAAGWREFYREARRDEQ